MTTKELFEKYERLCMNYPNDQDGFLYADKQNLIKEIEASIRKEVAQEEKERWVKIFDYHNDLASGRHTFYREAARVEIEYWDKIIKGITLK